MLYQIFVKAPGATDFTDITTYCVLSLDYEQVLMDPKTFKFARSSYDFEMVYDASTLWMFQSNVDKRIEAKVTLNGTTVFTGFIDNVRDVTLSTARQTYPISIIDRSVLLDRPLGANFERTQTWLYNPSTPNNSIISALLALSGESITVEAPAMVAGYGSNWGAHNVWIPYFCGDKDQVILDVLRDVCFESGYTFYFGPTGNLVLAPIVSTSASVTFSEANANILDPTFKMQRESFAEDSVAVKYKSLDTVELGNGSKNKSWVDSTPISSSFTFSTKTTKTKDRYVHCKIVLQDKTETGEKVYNWKPLQIRVFGGSWYQQNIVTVSENKWGVEYDVNSATVSDLRDPATGNRRTSNASFTNISLVKNVLEFDFYAGDWAKRVTGSNTKYYSVGCVFDGVIYDSTNVKSETIDGPNQTYLTLELKYGAQSAQASNLAKWYKNVAIDNPWTFSFSSYQEVALGTSVAISLPSKGISATGLVCRKSFDYVSQEYSYSVKQTSPITFVDPGDEGPTYNPTADLISRVEMAIDLQSGQLKQSINANYMPPVGIPDVPGLYVGSDGLGYFDGVNWRNRIDATGSGYFSGVISVGGDLRSSNYAQGQTGFILRSDGSAELNSLTINVELESDNYVPGVSGFKLDRTTGSAEFSNIVLRGTVYASNGAIGGFSIGNESLITGTGVNRVGLFGSNSNSYFPAIFAGAEDPVLAPFQVSKTGKLTSTSASIAGWDITTTRFEKNFGNCYVGFSSDEMEPVIYAGGITRATSPFRVTAQGNLYAENAIIKGQIEANTGKVGTWIINSTSLDSGVTNEARISLDKANMRVSVINSANSIVTAMGYLGGLLKNGSPWKNTTPYQVGDLANYNGITYKSKTVHTGGGYPDVNTTDWQVSTDVWTNTNYGFWAKQNEMTVIDGDVSVSNGDWIIGKDSSFLVKQGTEVVTRLGSLNGSIGVFINEAPSGNSTSASLTNGKLTIQTAGYSVSAIIGGPDSSGRMISAFTNLVSPSIDTSIVHITANASTSSANAYKTTAITAGVYNVMTHAGSSNVGADFYASGSAGSNYGIKVNGSGVSALNVGGFFSSGGGTTNYAVKAQVSGTGTNYGIYSSVNGGTNNYSFYTDSGKVWINDNTASTSTTTGALIVAGGAGIAGKINAGSVKINDSTAVNPGDYSTGALVVTGGISSGNTAQFGHVYSSGSFFPTGEVWFKSTGVNKAISWGGITASGLYGTYSRIYDSGNLTLATDDRIEFRHITGANGVVDGLYGYMDVTSGGAWVNFSGYGISNPPSWAGGGVASANAIPFYGGNNTLAGNGTWQFYPLIGHDHAVTGPGYGGKTTIGTLRIGNGSWNYGVYLGLQNAGPDYQQNQFYSLHNEGRINWSGGVPTLTAWSDERLKTNIRPISNALSKVLSIANSVAHFEYKKDPDKLHTGYIAQKLEANGFEGHVTSQVPMSEEDGELLGWEYEYTNEEYRDNDGTMKTRRVSKVLKEGDKVKAVDKNFEPYLFPAVAELYEYTKKLEARIAELEQRQ